jgi:hypothetical protein
MSTQPAYRAFTVIKREGADDFWLPIGAAFMHQDGDGYNIVLQALPIDGKIVLRPPKGDEQVTETGPRVVAGTEKDKASPRRRQ